MLRTVSSTKTAKSEQNQSTAAIGGINAFTGLFDYATARHLLNRCQFGASNTQILQAVEDGLTTTLDQILSNFIPETEPLNTSFTDDPNVPIGASWVDQPFAGGVPATTYRVFSLNQWTYKQLATETISIQEKLTLFWHNHFAIHDIKDARFGYRYASLLRTQCLGNFRELVKAICIDPMMLLFLNGHDNSATAPNENFARELLELFTIGKGDLDGPGDYTNYTEADISEMSRALTGWRYEGRLATDDTLPNVKFFPDRHDDTEKVLSIRFNNATIQAAGEEEYENVVDIIFQQEEVAKFICRKFYRWFVNFEINETIELEIISPLADILRAEDYEVRPVLEALFSSEHFLSGEMHGCQIKNPIDFAVGINRTCEVEMVNELAGNYTQHGLVGTFTELFQMRYFDPPTVAGWKAYYQSPSYYQTWLNSVTLPFRIRYSNAITGTGVTIFGSPVYAVKTLPLVAKLDDPFEVNGLIIQLARLLYPRDLQAGQIAFLKESLLGDLEDFEWETEYLEYAIDPTNEALAAPIRNRLANLFTVMTDMAEFQLM